MVWTDQSGPDGSSYGAFARLCDAAGVRSGAEFRVNEERSSTRYQPQVAALGNGGFVVGWQSPTSGTAGDGSGAGIFYQAFGNTAPEVQDVIAESVEDETLVFEDALFAAGFEDGDGQPLAAIRIGALPESGRLLPNGAPVAGGQEIAVADLAAGHLVYVPKPDFNGEDSFTWTGSDGITWSPDAALTRITVAPVNDPVGLEAGANANIGEGTTFSRQITLSDPDSDTYTVTVNYGGGNSPPALKPRRCRTIARARAPIPSPSRSATTRARSRPTASPSRCPTRRPMARDDRFATDEDTAISRNLFVSNGAGADTDPGNDPFTVAAVNGWPMCRAQSSSCLPEQRW